MLQLGPKDPFCVLLEDELLAAENEGQITNRPIFKMKINTEVGTILACKNAQ